MNQSHVAQFEEQKSPTDPEARAESPREKKWACEECKVGEDVGHKYLDQVQLDVEGCRACAGIAGFLALEGNGRWGPPRDYSNEPNPLGFGFNWSSELSCEFFIKTPSTFLESTTSLKVRADPSPSTSSAQAFDTLKRWIKKCEDGHDRCRSALPKQMPRRLMAIESIDPFTVRVVENDASGLAGQPPPRYACLSYRWSRQTKSNSLNKANLAVYKRRVPKDRLYPLIEDAITAAWKMDLRYIWIDAYCIIQDDKDDWHREAAMMGDIYENAFITISATPTTNQGRLFSQIRTPQLGYPITEHDNTPVFIRRCLEHAKFTNDEEGGFKEFVAPTEFVDDHARARFTHNRGWVFQERMLSTRVVHFLRGELFWECRESTWCECRSDEQAWEQRRAEVPRTIKTMTWDEMIQSYCETEFTKESDRLQALSSVARRYGEAHGKTYLAGMWFEDLASTFSWTAYLTSAGRKPRPLGCSAPSWSWTLHSTQKQLPHFGVFLSDDSPRPPCILDFLGYSRDPPVHDVYADSHSIKLTIAGPTVSGTIFPRDKCVVIGKTAWRVTPDFDMRPEDPSRYRVVEEGSQVLVLLCRGTEDDCPVLQGVDTRGSSNEVGTEVFERIGRLSFEVASQEELDDLTDEVRRRLCSDDVDGQRFRHQAERRTITLI